MTGEVVEQTVEYLPTDELRANEYNPNRMADEKFAELVEEVRHLGRLPKPVIVRPDADGYLIVDGEHGWRAARETGLSEVPCEVVEVDDFEAMRQTYKRNQHGTHDKPALGRMFEAMREERDLSNRELAKEMAVSEGTVRNAVMFAEAARLRNSYAPGDGDSVGSVSVRALRTYVALPEVVRDAWLNAGADSRAVWDAARIRVPLGVGEKTETVSIGEPEDWRALLNVGLAEYLDDSNTRAFVRSGRMLWRLERWLASNGRYLVGAEEYVKIAADLGLDTEWLETLPIEPELQGGKGQPMLTPERWGRVFEDAASRAEEDGQFRAMVNAGLRVAFHEVKGTADPDGSNPIVADALRLLDNAPAFIRDADISLPEKFTVATAEADVPEDAMREAQRRTCSRLEQRQRVLEGRSNVLERLGETERLALQAMWNVKPADILDGELTRVMSERKTTETRALFEDRDRLTEAVVGKLREASPKTFEADVDGTAAWQVLEQRLKAMPWPELVLFASVLLRAPVGGWLKAVREEVAA